MVNLRTVVDLNFTPVECGDWLESHVVYSKFNRQGINIICAAFEHPVTGGRKPRANIVLVTGWSETFLKYSTLIKVLFERGYNVHTYDHQSQGLSGRWLSEPQSTWINNFEDYVDDFIFFVTTISRESNYPLLPTFLIAHSMGGLICAIAMSRLPTLINRAILCSPMIRNKCGMKAVNYQYPLPQNIAYWFTWLACRAGLGSMHAIGFFKEESTDPLPARVTTSDPHQLSLWRELRKKYPQVMATCVTNDWLIQALRAQKKFATRFEFVRTNTLILAAENDVFVYNRAMAMFLQKAPCCKMFFAPDAFHELLFENDAVRSASFKAINDFFAQVSDDVSLVHPSSPLVNYQKDAPIYTVTETILRTSGVVIAGVGVVLGLSLVFGRTRR